MRTRFVPLQPGWKEHVVLGLIKVRAGLLGLLALLMLGSLTAVPASANTGPFCYHRDSPTGAKEKIKAQHPEPFQGPGEVQLLKFVVGGTTPITIQSTISQIKGVVYNTADQCQLKAQIHYQNPKLVEPNFPNCKVAIGSAGDNNIQIFGEFMWKYSGNAGELTEQPQTNQRPDLVVWPAALGELVQGKGEVPSGELTKVKFTGTECGAFLNGVSTTVKGTVGVSVANSQGEEGVEKFDKKFIFITLATAWQHFWNGALPYVEFKPALTASIGATTYTGSFKIEMLSRQQNPVQEIALLEGP